MGIFRALPDLLRRRLASRLRWLLPVINATNLTRYFRRPLLRIAQEFGCADAEALYFDVPLKMP